MGLKEDTDKLKELYKDCIMPWGISITELYKVGELYSHITFEYLGEDLLKYDNVYKEISKTLDNHRIDLLNYEVAALLNNKEVKKCIQLYKYWGFNDYMGYVPRYGAKDAYYNNIIKLYDILQPYEHDIMAKAKSITFVYNLNSSPSNEVYCSHDCQMLLLLKEICIFYHDEIECIREELLKLQPNKEVELKELPKELNTDEFKQIYEKAINAGLCDESYKWLKTDALLAYFAGSVSDELKLGKGEYNGKLKRAWKPFESLFGIKGLCGKYEDYEKKSDYPLGYEDVDSLFQ